MAMSDEKVSSILPDVSAPVPSAPAPGTLPDLVLVFTPLLKTQVENKSAPSGLLQERAAEYDALVVALQKVGFFVASRPAGPSQPSAILLFLKASEAALISVASADRINDYLHGAQTNSDNAAEHLQVANPFAIAPAYTPADALRYAYTLATAPPLHAEEQVATESGKIAGAGVRTDGTGPFPHVTDLTPLHDKAFDHAWFHKWTPLLATLSLDVQDLDAVRNHYGEEVALYFGFLVFYFKMQAPLAILGFGYWLVGGAYSSVYSLALVVWSCVVVELWAIREKQYAVRWGCHGVTKVDPRWSGFTPRTTVKDAITGQTVEVYEWWRREIWNLSSIIVMIIFALVLAAVLTGNFVLEIFVTQLYTGKGAAILSQAPTVVFTVAIPVVMGIWQATATYLSKRENPETEQSYHWSLTIKVFTLQCIVSYGALILSAYVYIPFGQRLLNALISYGFFHSFVDEAVTQGQLHRDAWGKFSFKIDPGRLHSQLFASCVTAQITNAFTELLLPIILRQVSKRTEKRQAQKAQKAKNEGQAPACNEDRKPKGLVGYALDQLALPEYDIFGDYAEMAQQFGYIVLWSTIWTLGGVMGWINNYQEVKGDAAKLCLNVRRPIPRRAESIGPWLEVLRTLSYLAAVSNVALLWLFQAAPGTKGGANATVLRDHAAWGGIHQSATSLSEKMAGVSNAPESIDRGLDGPAMMFTLFAALSGGQIWWLLKSIVDRVVRLALWQGSTQQVRLARRAYRARTSLLGLFSLSRQEPHHQAAPKAGPMDVKAGQLSGGKLAQDYHVAQKDKEHQPTEEGFWLEPNVSPEAILNYAKTE